MPDTITGKKFVIIGGSAGIGYGIAELILQQGAAEVIIASSTQTRIDAAVADLSKISSAKVSGKVLDMKDTKNVPPFFESIGNFDHLVSTAGGPLPQAKFPGETDIEEVMAASNDRYWSVLKAIQAAHKKINAGGSITVTSGTTIKRPLPGWSALSGVAGAIETATRNLAIDMAPIRVNCVAPGVVATPLWDKVPNRDAIFKGYSEKLPVGHVGTPEEVAEAYLFCFRCTYLTGQTLFVDGGGLLV